MFFTIPPGKFYCLERLELSMPMLPNQELDRATKTMIKEESDRFTAFQRLQARASSSSCRDLYSTKFC